MNFAPPAGMTLREILNKQNGMTKTYYFIIDTFYYYKLYSNDVATLCGYIASENSLKTTRGRSMHGTAMKTKLLA